MTFEEYTKRIAYANNIPSSARRAILEAQREYERNNWQEEMSKWKPKYFADVGVVEIATSACTKTNSYLSGAPYGQKYCIADLESYLCAIKSEDSKPISFDDAMGFGKSDGE